MIGLKVKVFGRNYANNIGIVASEPMLSAADDENPETAYIVLDLVKNLPLSMLS